MAGLDLGKKLYFYNNKHVNVRILPRCLTSNKDCLLGSEQTARMGPIGLLEWSTNDIEGGVTLRGKCHARGPTLVSPSVTRGAKHDIAGDPHPHAGTWEKKLCLQLNQSGSGAWTTAFNDQLIINLGGILVQQQPLQVVRFWGKRERERDWPVRERIGRFCKGPIKRGKKGLTPHVGLGPHPRHPIKNLSFIPSTPFNYKELDHNNYPFNYKELDHNNYPAHPS
ncbi:hypothetical protein H6P81_019729 [Aristolochia fimbriata]|uniref:Ribosomal protein L2 n=1 Tax=Aristolochia fimbriata TaxID=158543 RepID=A0AAV7DSS1_ARIFI|nr:hypothetical protein H6P81_019729 [Aristolochia fimbriata]